MTSMPVDDAQVERTLRRLAAVLLDIASNPRPESVNDSSRSVGLISSESSPIGTRHAVVESSADEVRQPLPRTARSNR